MAIISSCCCWKSIRRGSFASGFYTLIYYSFLVIGGSFQVDSYGTPQPPDTKRISEQPGAPLPFTVAVLATSGITVLASIVLLVGLCVDNRLFLLPWIVSLSLNTLICSIYSIYMIATMSFKPLLAAVFTLDFFISLLNIYCLLCVISQYQEYKQGRGRAEDDMRLYQPPVKYDAWGNSLHPCKRTVTFQENGRPSSALGNKNGNSIETKNLLTKGESNSLHHQRPRIHFQDERESSETKGLSVTHDSPSTDTTSSRLQSEVSVAMPSPPQKQRRVQFSSEVIDDSLRKNNETDSNTTLAVPNFNEKSCKDDSGKHNSESSENLSNGIPSNQFISPANESLPLLVPSVQQ